MDEYGIPTITPCKGSLHDRVQQAIDYAGFLQNKRDDNRRHTYVMLAVWGTDGPLIKVGSGDTAESVLSSDKHLMLWRDDSETVKADSCLHPDDLFAKFAANGTHT